MSGSPEDPVGVLEQYFAAVRAHDPEALRTLFADDAVLVSAGGTFHGPEEIARFYREGAFAFDDLWPTPGPLLVDGDRLAVEIELRMGGRTVPVGDFFTITAGKISRLVVYMGA